MHWLPIPQDEAEDKGYWLVTMRDIYVRGQPLHLCDGYGDDARCQVAMDTGSSLTMASAYQVSVLMQQIGLKDDCSNIAKLPTLHLIFDAEAGASFDMALTPEDYMDVVDNSTEGCAPSFQSIKLPPNLGRMLVLGQNVLRRYYTVYDAKRWRIGLGLAAHTTKRRARPTEPPVPTTPSPQEICEDDDADMQKPPFSLPGCTAFARMGYCKRFQPLANHYCRLACGFCKPPQASTSKAPLQDTPPVAKAPVAEAQDDEAAPAVVVRGGGMGVATSGRIVIKGRDAHEML
jgi:hypothetical protein